MEQVATRVLDGYTYFRAIKRVLEKPHVIMLARYDVTRLCILYELFTHVRVTSHGPRLLYFLGENTCIGLFTRAMR